MQGRHGGGCIMMWELCRVSGACSISHFKNKIALSIVCVLMIKEDLQMPKARVSEWKLFEEATGPGGKQRHSPHDPPEGSQVVPKPERLHKIFFFGLDSPLLESTWCGFVVFYFSCRLMIDQRGTLVMNVSFIRIKPTSFKALQPEHLFLFHFKNNNNKRQHVP